MLFFAVSLGLKTTVYTMFPIFLSYTVSFIVFSVIESPLDFITQTRKEGGKITYFALCSSVLALTLRILPQLT